MFWLGLSVGLLAGATSGVVVMAAMCAGKDSNFWPPRADEAPKNDNHWVWHEDEVIAWQQRHCKK